MSMDMSLFIPTWSVVIGDNSFPSCYVAFQSSMWWWLGATALGRLYFPWSLQATPFSALSWPKGIDIYADSCQWEWLLHILMLLPISMNLPRHTVQPQVVPNSFLCLMCPHKENLLILAQDTTCKVIWLIPLALPKMCLKTGSSGHPQLLAI